MLQLIGLVKVERREREKKGKKRRTKRSAIDGPSENEIGHCQSDRHSNCFKSIREESFDRRGETHIGFPYSV